MSIRRFVAAAVAALAATATLTTAPAGASPPSSGAAYCGITWGSGPKATGDPIPGNLTAVRAGQHTCYDRLVVDMTGRAPGYNVRYVAAVRAEGSGAVVPVPGGARLAVTVKKGALTVPRMPSVAGFRTFRGVVWAGSFEGYTTMGLGVRARLPFRVFTIYDAGTNTSRLVVDVAHLW